MKKKVRFGEIKVGQKYVDVGGDLVMVRIEDEPDSRIASGVLREMAVESKVKSDMLDDDDFVILIEE